MQTNYRSDIEQALNTFDAGNEERALRQLEEIVRRMSNELEQTDDALLLAKRFLANMLREMQLYKEAFVLFSELYDLHVQHLGLDYREPTTREYRNLRDELLAREDDELFERLYGLNRTLSIMTAYYGEPVQKMELEDGGVMVNFNGLTISFDAGGRAIQRVIEDASVSVLGAQIGMTLDQTVKRVGLRYLLLRDDQDPNAKAHYAVFYRGNHYVRVHAPGRDEPTNYIVVGRK